jgi:LCP family protein required for cell wall assembly
MASRPQTVDPNAPLPPHLDPRGRHRGQHGSRFHAYRLVGGSMLALLSVFLLLFAGYLWWNFRTLNQGLHRLPIDFHQGQPSNAPDVDGTDQNILVVGNDDRSNLSVKEARDLHVGLDGGSLATDTMMVVHIPADGSKAQILSLPRDAYVNIPGYGMNKLNAAYVNGYNSLKQGATADERRTAGANVLIHTISNLTGLTIDHFVQVSLIGFVKISDAVGGVTINLCGDVDDSVAANQAAGMDGNGSGFKMSKGEHKISGVTALEFVRQRHFLPNGDLDRAARQRYFLTQAFSKISSAGTLLNPSRLSGLVKAIDQAIYVDSGLDLTKLAVQVGNLDPNNIKGKLIPFEGFDHDSPVGDVEIVNPAKVKAFVDKLFHPDKYPAPPTKHHHKKHNESAEKCIN